jgi:hypothetical protein
MSMGAEWRAEVKAALAANNRTRRRRRKPGPRVIGPGMVRLPANGAAGGEGPAAKGGARVMGTGAAILEGTIPAAR